MFLATLIITLGIFHFLAPQIQAYYPDPQYIFVRKDYMCQNCILWNGHYPNNYSYEAIADIVNKVGTKGSDSRKLGVGSLWSYHLVDNNLMAQSLQNMLTVSQIHEFPVFISLDGFQWWDDAPELWNWWDSTKPGYNPDNKKNVEWTSWDSNSAIKISWRNWGRQLRVKPHPNLASPAFIQANKDALSRLVPIIVKWYNQLPDNKKYLLGGVGFSQEVDVGINYTYYPNGNDLLNKPESGDPQNFLQGSVQLGYAAVKTAGIKSSGSLTEADLDRVVSNYIETLNFHAVSLGLPRHKIFNQVGGKGFAPFEHPHHLVVSTAKASITAHGNPGWSFYNDVTENPQNYPALSQALDQAGNSLWASPEWLTFSQTGAGWVNALRNSLNFRNNKFINITSWETIRDNSEVLAAIRTVLGETPDCLVATPLLHTPTVSGNQVSLAWTQSANATGTYLNCANSPSLNQKGNFTLSNVVNSPVSATSFQKSNLANGTYYCQVITDGCNPVKRTMSEILTFNVGPTATPTPPSKCTLCSDSLAKSRGDANCDGQTSLVDSEIWRSETFDQGGLDGIIKNTWRSDFNCDSQIGLVDFEIWRQEYMK